MTDYSVSSGSTSSGITLSGGDVMTVYNGGIATSTTISNGGSQTISSGGSATSTMVSNGGSQTVSANGSATDTTVYSGGYQAIYDAGDAIDTIVSGGSQVILELGSAVSTTVDSGGSQAISTGGFASNTTIDASGSQVVHRGATASGTTISNGGTEMVRGIADVTTISSGGFQTISAGHAISTTILGGGSETVDSGGIAQVTTISNGGVQAISSGGVANPTTISNGGTQYVYSSGLASDTTVSNGGVEFVYSGGSATSTTVSSGGYEVISSMNAVVSDTALIAGGTIDITWLTSNADETANINNGTLTVSGGGQSYTQQLAGTYNELFLNLTSGTYGGTDVTLYSVCFCPGTLIATPAGEKRVQDLAVGDLVMTLRGEARPITWIGTGEVLATRGRRTAATPVIVRRGALADNVPHHDLHVTKGHSLFLDGALIPIEFLVNNRSIYWDDRAQEVRLYHIELQTHDVLIANGAPAESYRDDGNRWLFRNANETSGRPAQQPCAPVLTGGELVDAVWRRLLDRAGPRDSVPLTGNPDLHLQVDGKRIDPMERRDTMYAFRLRTRPHSIRICSRSAVPQELGTARDNREIGVAVRRIIVAQPRSQRTVTANAASLTEGYHAFEPDNGIRWTNGDAVVPADLFADVTGPCTLVLHLGGGTDYLDNGRNVKVA